MLIVALLSIIAHGIMAWQSLNSDEKIQVIGLSASLTYAVEYKAVEQALANLCADLAVTKMISPSEQDLVNGGYIPQDDMIETMKKPWDNNLEDQICVYKNLRLDKKQQYASQIWQMLPGIL